MTDETIRVATGPADRRGSTWVPILLRIGLLIAVVGLLAGGAQLLGPWSSERLRELLAEAALLASAAFVGLFVVLNCAGLPRCWAPPGAWLLALSPAP